MTYKPWCRLGALYAHVTIIKLIIIIILLHERVQLPDKAVALTSQDLPLVTAWQRLLLSHHQKLPANSNESSKIESKQWTYVAARLLWGLLSED